MNAAQELMEARKILEAIPQGEMVTREELHVAGAGRVGCSWVGAKLEPDELRRAWLEQKGRVETLAGFAANAEAAEARLAEESARADAERQRILACIASLVGKKVRVDVPESYRDILGATTHVSVDVCGGTVSVRVPYTDRQGRWEGLSTVWTIEGGWAEIRSGATRMARDMAQVAQDALRRYAGCNGK